MRQCLFCEKLADTHEDIWPRWLTKRFAGARPSQISATVRGIDLEPWRQVRPELRVKRVCESCNNGWMSDLENEAKLVIEPMLAGQSLVLGSSAQEVLAVWACKTAMAMEGVEEPDLHMYTRDDRAQLRESRTIPERTAIWMASSSEASLILSEKTEHNNALVDASAHAVASTLVFGPVALQVFTIKVRHTISRATPIVISMLKGPWYESTTRISAPSVQPVSWPPARALNGEDELWRFSGRFRIGREDGANCVSLSI
jgi:hypothetical protein